MDGIVGNVIGAAVLLLYPTWRIFSRAGLNSALSLTVLIPYVGILVSGIILAASEWKIRGEQ